MLPVLPSPWRRRPIAAISGAVALVLLGPPLALQAAQESGPGIGLAEAPPDTLAFGESVRPDAPTLDETAPPERSELEEFVERFTADRAVLFRFYDVDSPRRRARLEEFLQSWEDRLDEADFESWGVEGRIDYHLLRNRIRYERRVIEIDQQREEAMAPLTPFAPDLVALQEDRRALERVDPEEAAGILDSVRRSIEETRAGVEAALRGDAPDAPDTFTDPVVARRAFMRLEGLASMVDEWFHFHDDYDPLFGWWVRTPYEEFDETLAAYIDFLRREVVGIRPGEEEPIVGDPLGREALEVDLRAELVPFTPEELIEIAWEELAWGEERMRRAAEALGYDDWEDALEHVKGLHVEPGEQRHLVTEMAREAEEFLEERDLVTIPPLAKEIWRMEMLSPERQRFAPFFLGGEVVRVAFPTESMTHEEKLMSLRANNPHFSRAVVHHELIPGHHLQGFMTQRYQTHRSVFSTPFWGEGWALYWEMLLWDEDFPRGPEDEIGMLFWRNHRAARIIFSLSFHLGEMTPQEAIDFLVERVGHERASATAEVRRSFAGDYSPLYQVAYMWGGLQLRQLHRDLVESGEMSNRDFHDHILKSGRMPIETVRASVTGELLPRDWEPSWRFYEGTATDGDH